MSDTLSPQEIQSLRNMGNEAESAADEIERLRSELDQMRTYAAAAVAMERERCAKVCEPKGKRPCDCTNCDCGNSTDARMVAEWDEAMARATAIRAG